jgi:hypothetical protein
LDCALDAGSVVVEGGPRPIGGVFDQALFYWVAVEVAELFDALLCGEDVEVVVAGEPEGALFALDGDGEFQGFDGGAEEDFGWLAYEEVDVFGHDDVAADGEGVADTDLFEERSTRSLAAGVER